MEQYTEIIDKKWDYTVLAELDVEAAILPELIEEISFLIDQPILNVINIR